MLFFSFAGDYFTTRDAKRLYGFIAGGLPVGTILGGLVVKPIVPLVGTANLLFVYMGLLLLGIALSLFIHRRGQRVADEEPGSAEATAPLSAILSNPYVKTVFIFVLLGMASYVIVEYQMTAAAPFAPPAPKAAPVSRRPDSKA